MGFWKYGLWSNQQSITWNTDDNSPHFFIVYIIAQTVVLLSIEINTVCTYMFCQKTEQSFYFQKWRIEGIFWHLYNIYLANTSMVFYHVDK